jgi:predicted permease
MLVVVQVTVSLVLMVAATLFTGTLRHLRSIAPGPDASHVLGMQLMNQPGGYRGMDPVSYYSGLYERLAHVPGVRSVSAATFPPVMPPVFLDQAIAAGGATANAQWFLVAPRFFETMQIPLIAGRDFTFRDAAQAPAVAIVSESLARSLFPSREAVGQHVTLAGEDAKDLIIAGVVRDSPTGSPQKHNPMQLFRSVFQDEVSARQPYVLVRSVATPTGALAEQLRKEVEALGREYPIRTETMERAMARALVQERLMASLAGAFGVLALLLAAAGLYGLMSYSVTRRTRDIGIRMALGAKQGTIVSMIIRESLMLVGAGFALSVPAVYAGSRMVSTMLYGLRPLDPAALGTAAVVLLGSALLAVYLPARRAANLDPMVALRCE